MFILKYTPGCRDCLQTDSEHMFLINDANPEEYLNYTEFHMMQEVEQWRSDDCLSCSFCNSLNVEVFDIKVDDNLLLNDDRLVHRFETKSEWFLQIKIWKRNGRTKFEIGGIYEQGKAFSLGVYNRTIELLNHYPDSYFSNKNNGHFYICFSNRPIRDYGIPILRIETLRFAGFSKQNILNEIISLKSEF